MNNNDLEIKEEKKDTNGEPTIEINKDNDP